ncbi:MAG TPA: hypothetical protein VGF44_16485 [Terriglobales bacterium]|jgi:hypothetical protein
MGTLKKSYLSVCILIVFSSHVLGQNTISAREAKNHIGQNATVCGRVESTHFASTSRGQPTFLNLDGVYPNQIFTVVIWGTDRAKFGRPEERYRNEPICVTGEIRLYHAIPEVIVMEPAQIKNSKN